MRFWYLGEYSKNTGTNDGRWGNWIAEIGVGSVDLIFADGFESGGIGFWG